MTGCRTRQTVTSITGVNGETGATVGTVDVSNTTHTERRDVCQRLLELHGHGQLQRHCGDDDHERIDKANAMVVVTPYDVAYDGLSHTADSDGDHGRERGDGGDGGHGGREQHDAHQRRHVCQRLLELHGHGQLQRHRGDADHNEIDKANATLVVTPYDVTYDGLSHTATVSSITGVNGETGATVGTVDVSNTTHTNAGTYAGDPGASRARPTTTT